MRGPSTGGLGYLHGGCLKAIIFNFSRRDYRMGASITFYGTHLLGNRSISEIPHFVPLSISPVTQNNRRHVRIFPSDSLVLKSPGPHAVA